MTNNDKIKHIVIKVAELTEAAMKDFNDSKFYNSAEWAYSKSRYETLLRVLESIERIEREA